MAKRKQTTALPRALREELGLGARKGKKQELGRKERRKLERQQKKQKRSRQHSHSQPQPQAQASTSAQPHAKPNAQPSKKRPRPESDEQPRAAKHAAPSKDPYIEAEEREIERLEKLLGLTSTGKKSKEQKKLNKELALDGFGDDFADFLERLDKIGTGEFGKEEEQALRRKQNGEDDDDDRQSDLDGSDDEDEEVDEDDPFDDDIPRPAQDYEDSDFDDDDDDDDDEEEEEEEEEVDEEVEGFDEDEDADDAEEYDSAGDDEVDDDVVNADAADGENDGEDDEEAPALVDASRAGRLQSSNPLAEKDPYILQEEQEIARLEKLLGIKGESKSKKLRTLKKEMKKDGFDEDFVDFLDDLDNLSSSIRSGKQERVLSARDDDYDSDAQDVRGFHGQHEDDEVNEENEDEENEDDEEEDEDEAEDEEVDEEGEEEEEEEEDDDDDDEEAGEQQEDEEGDEGKEEEDKGQYYRPTVGEDIYGRSTTGEQKYVPPAQRASALRIDETSDAYILIKRRVNGLMNRLSFETKDGILRDLKTVYAANSKNMTNNALKDAIFAACANESQMMSSLIPLYAGMVVALHYVVGMEVGGYVLEHVFLRLHAALEKGQVDESAAISSKVASNMMLLLAYMYNLGIVHGAFMKEIVDTLMAKFEEMHIELLLVVFKYCGQQLRHDDQMGFRALVTEMQNRARDMDSTAAASEEGDVRARVKFMVQMLADLNGKKERKNQGSAQEQVQQLRKWLGQVKSSIGGLDRDVMLRMTVNDLIHANERGRWWLPGASWKGKEIEAEKRSSTVALDVKGGDEQMEQLLQLATKMRMNTDIRKKIFVVIMSSRDVEDAVERLLRLNLKGSQDREIPRVILDCCGQERKYNPFYVNLAKRLCELNRQFKTTFQYSFWDAIKQIEEVPERRIVNLARFLAALICSFHLSLAVFKVVDLAALRSKGVLFIATCLMSLFSARVPEDTFSSVLDRVAASADHRAVRDMLILFLQKYLPDVPEGLDEEERKTMRKRRKAMIRVFEDMSVLDMVS